MAHVCPWWGGYFIDNRFRRLLHKPEVILAPYVWPGMTVLDFGCGMGFCAIPMAQLVGSTGRVIAVDLQQRMLDTLNQRARKEGVEQRIDTRCCQRDCLGVVGPVDFAVAFYSAHEVPDLRRVLGEFYDSLRDGGRLLVVEPIGHVTAKQFEAMLSFGRDIGFAVESRPCVRLSHAVLLARKGG